MPVKDSWSTSICAHCRREFRRYKAQKFCSRPCYLAHQHEEAIQSQWDRFWQNVRKTETCWIWTGSRRHGYGQTRINCQNAIAHRVSYELEHGAGSAEGWWVLHNCPGGDNPACVNPAHLRLGTHQENIADAWTKGQMPVGEAHHAAKLKASDVLAIRTRTANGERISQDRLAAEYGVSRRAIAAILKRQTWRHV